MGIINRIRIITNTTAKAAIVQVFLLIAFFALIIFTFTIISIKIAD